MKTKQERQREIEKASYSFKNSVKQFNIYVKNVPTDLSSEELQAYFSQFGEVRYARVMPEKSGGFVSFKEKESATQAVQQSGNLVLKTRQIFTCYYQPRE